MVKLSGREEYPIYFGAKPELLMLVIEVDGEVHVDPYQKERDIERTKILKSLGLKELRFTNSEILNNINIALDKIKNELK